MPSTSIVYWSSDVPEYEAVERSNRLREACAAEANATGNIEGSKTTWPGVIYGCEEAGDIPPDGELFNICMRDSWAQEFEVVDLARKQIVDSDNREFNSIIKGRAIESEVRDWILSEENKDTVLTSEMISKFRRGVINRISMEEDQSAMKSRIQCIERMNESRETGKIFGGEVDFETHPAQSLTTRLTKRSMHNTFSGDNEASDTKDRSVPPEDDRQTALHKVGRSVNLIDLMGGKSGSNSAGHNKIKTENEATKTGKRIDHQRDNGSDTDTSEESHDENDKTGDNTHSDEDAGNSKTTDEVSELESQSRHDKIAASEKNTSRITPKLHKFADFILNDIQKRRGTFTQRQSIACLKWFMMFRGFDIDSNEFKASETGLRYQRAFKEITSRYENEPNKALSQTKLVRRIRNELKNCRKACIEGSMIYRGKERTFDELLPDPADIMALACLDRQGDVHNSINRELFFLPNSESRVFPSAGQTNPFLDTPNHLGNNLVLATQQVCKSLVKSEIQASEMLATERFITMDTFDDLKRDFAKGASQRITEDITKKVSESSKKAMDTLIEKKNYALEKKVKEMFEGRDNRFTEIEKQLKSLQESIASLTSPAKMPSKKRHLSEHRDSDLEQTINPPKRPKVAKTGGRTKKGPNALVNKSTTKHDSVGKAGKNIEIQERANEFDNDDLYD